MCFTQIAEQEQFLFTLHAVLNLWVFVQIAAQKQLFCIQHSILKHCVFIQIAFTKYCVFTYCALKEQCFFYTAGQTKGMFLLEDCYTRAMEFYTKLCIKPNFLYVYFKEQFISIQCAALKHCVCT